MRIYVVELEFTKNINVQLWFEIMFAEFIKSIAWIVLRQNT